MMEKSVSKRMSAAASALIIIVSALIAGTFSVYMVWSNATIAITEITVRSERLPDAFDGVRIAHVSDLHNAEFGESSEKLLNMISSCTPDIIVITGDLVDSRHTDIDAALRFTEKAVGIAPVYYVTGNHEAVLGSYDELKQGLLSAGVTVLNDGTAVWERGDETVNIVGLDDPNFTVLGSTSDIVSAMVKSKLTEMVESGGFNILLCHRPELFDTYASCGIDVTLCGHAHGGQFRLPFIGGVYAPNQGFFPKYDGGLYTNGATSMIVSRGLGNSVIPVRFNNRPEIVVAELHK